MRFVLPPQRMHGDDLENIQNLWIMAIYNSSYFFCQETGSPKELFQQFKKCLMCQERLWQHWLKILREGRTQNTSANADFQVPWTLFLQNSHTPQSFSTEILPRYKSRHDGEGAHSLSYLELVRELHCVHDSCAPFTWRTTCFNRQEVKLDKIFTIVLSSSFPYPPPLVRSACTAGPAICSNNIVTVWKIQAKLENLDAERSINQVKSNF